LSRIGAIDLRLSDILKSNIQKTGRSEQIMLHEGMSKHILRNPSLNAYDFIYVDGSHQTIDVLEDAVAAFQLAKVGAIIAFDDYIWDAPPWSSALLGERGLGVEDLRPTQTERQMERVEQRRGTVRKVTAEVEQQLRGWVQAQPDLTLGKLQQKLAKADHLQVSIGRLWQVLRQMGLG
jgi:hypothetical protein